MAWGSLLIPGSLAVVCMSGRHHPPLPSLAPCPLDSPSLALPYLPYAPACICTRYRGSVQHFPSEPNTAEARDAEDGGGEEGSGGEQRKGGLCGAMGVGCCLMHLSGLILNARHMQTSEFVIVFTMFCEGGRDGSGWW